MASLIAQLVKNPPAMQETWVWRLGWEDPLGEGKGYSSILAWRILGVANSQTWLSNFHFQSMYWAPQVVVKNLLSMQEIGDSDSIPGLERCPGEGNGNPLQYSCQGNFMDREAWEATVHGVTNSWTWLSDWACNLLIRMKRDREEYNKSFKLNR